MSVYGFFGFFFSPLSKTSMINSPSVCQAAQFSSYAVGFYQADVRRAVYLGCMNPAQLGFERSW